MSCLDVFEYVVSRDIGGIDRCAVLLVPSGLGGSWFLDHILISGASSCSRSRVTGRIGPNDSAANAGKRDGAGGEIKFPCKKWIGKNGKEEVVLYAGEERIYIVTVVTGYTLPVPQYLCPKKRVRTIGLVGGLGPTRTCTCRSKEQTSPLIPSRCSRVGPVHSIYLRRAHRFQNSEKNGQRNYYRTNLKFV